MEHMISMQNQSLFSNAEVLISDIKSINQAEETHKIHPDEEASFSHLFAEATLGNLETTKPEIQVLGVGWDPDDDQNFEPTKRNVVSTIGKFYDTLRFMAPTAISFKIFLQVQCERKIAGMIYFFRRFSSRVADSSKIAGRTNHVHQADVLHCRHSRDDSSPLWFL